ncbi:MAG: hypothetical protein EOO06_19135 [Chitinophagaceae bacterium]|nr:MAG: hypothetical protein EOO06_19135 [Chitinophagaceae bacterium]
MNQNAPCRLCGKTAKLLKKSHVIPKFMYNGIHDELNRMIVANLNSLDAKPKFQQSGYSDKYVLCAKCDNELIAKLERYVALVLFGGHSTEQLAFENAVGPDGIKSIFIKNIDYSRFKLCLLSILWRAHISSNKFFKNVDLKENAEPIRQMLLTNDPKDETEYKISIVAVRNHEGLLRMVFDPAIVQIGNGYVAIFFINGIFYFIDLVPSSDFAVFQKHFLTSSGTYEVMLLDGQQAAAFMSAFGLPAHMVNYYFQS